MQKEHIVLPGRTFVARHAETVFNAGGRIQAELLHTPLTRRGIAQADAMGAALARLLPPGHSLELWASPTGRTLQTLAVICEHLDLDWHGVRQDARLGEIAMGGWDGRLYAELEAELGPIYDRETRVFIQRPADGESYADVAARVGSWLGEQQRPVDRLVLTHGITGSVLRALATGTGRAHPQCGTLVAAPLPQGSVVMIADGREEVVYRASEGEPA